MYILVFLEQRKMTSPTKQAHVPIPASVPRKGGDGPGGGGGRGRGNYVCVCFCVNLPKSYVFFIFWP